MIAPFRDYSIRQKLTMMVILASGTAILLACTALFTYEQFVSRENMVRSLSTQADVIGANSASAILFNDVTAAAETLEALKADTHIVSAGIYTHSPQAFATYGRHENVSFDQQERFADRNDGFWFESDHLILAKKIVFKGETIGTVIIESDLEAMKARFRQYLVIIFCVFMMSASVAVFISSRLQRRITLPLLSLVETVQTVSLEKDYSIRATTGSRDEMGVLVGAFNDMLEQIQQRDVALKKSSDEMEQRVLDRTAALNAVNKELEAFSYSVSHDLRAPLRSIDGFSQVLLEDYEKQLDADGKDHLARIRAASQRMGHLIDDLINLSRVSRSEISRQSVDLTGIVWTIVADLQTMNPERQVTVQVADALVAQGDPNLLRMVLENLLRNAWKYSSKCEHAHIQFGSTRYEDELAFFVRDNGAGFDMAHAGKLFGAFQRMHAAKEFEGTGIGLATVQRIIHRHGGRVWAMSKIGEGATFYFTCSPRYESAEDQRDERRAA